MEGVSVMLLTRLWRRVVKRDRQPSTTTPMRLFWQANRDREAGRFEEAAALVERGLHLDPDNVVGLLLAGSLHAVFREMHLAKSAFERVLALDAAHPRALLGLARIAMEEGQLGTCTDYLRRALTRYPEFPEAQALLEVASHSEPAAASHSAPRPEVRLDRLRVPADSREALLARIDATLIFAQPRGARTEEIAARTSQLCRVASAMLSRCQLGPLHHAVLEGAAETTFLRADEDVVLSIAFGHDVEIETGLAHLERVWANCRHELGMEVA